MTTSAGPPVLILLAIPALLPQALGPTAPDLDSAAGRVFSQRSSRRFCCWSFSPACWWLSAACSTAPESTSWAWICRVPRPRATSGCVDHLGGRHGLRRISAPRCCCTRPSWSWVHRHRAVQLGRHRSEPVRRGKRCGISPFRTCARTRHKPGWIPSRIGAPVTRWCSQFSFATGEVFGTGLGNGQPGTVPPPRPTSSPRWWGGLGLVGLAGVLLLYDRHRPGPADPLAVRDSFGKLLAAGLASTLAIQLFIVVGGVTGLIR